MTRLTDDLLVAFADGELDDGQSDAVGRVLKRDPLTARRVEALRATHRQLNQTFQAMLTATATDSRLADLMTEPGSFSQQWAAQQESVARVSDSDTHPSDRQTSREPTTERYAPQPHPTAASREPAPEYRSFASRLFRKTLKTLQSTAVLITGALLGFVLGSVPPAEDAGREIPDPRGQITLTGDWWDAVINQHAVLGRDAIKVSLESRGDRDLARFQLSGALGVPVGIPEFGRYDMEFQRAQLLSIGEEKVAQILYLSRKGPPLALYARTSRTGAEENTVDQRVLGALNSISWTHRGITYVLAGYLPQWQLIVMSVVANRQMNNG